MNVSKHGFWLWVAGRELFVAFRHFRWFRDASIGELLDVTRPSEGHLYWRRLDIDLALESIEHPERFPLVSRLPARSRRRKGRARARAVLAKGQRAAS